MLRLARQLARLSQGELAQALEVSNSLISKIESGDRPIPNEVLRRASAVLKQPMSFFSWDGEICAASTIFHRRKASTLMRDVEFTNATINYLRLKLVRILASAKISTRRKLHRLYLSPLATPADAARQLRASWQIPSGPIDNLAALMDSAGVVIEYSDQFSDDVDGLSLWPLGEEHLPPLVLLRSGIPTDRMRLTLAHELGHLVLHHMPSNDYEKDANIFAAEFLMPEDDIKGSLTRLTLPIAAALKSKWKVSMQALIVRSHELGEISTATYRRLMTEISTKGYRKCEPVLLPPETPKLASSIAALLERSAPGKNAQVVKQTLKLHSE